MSFPDRMQSHSFGSVASQQEGSFAGSVPAIDPHVLQRQTGLVKW